MANARHRITHAEEIDGMMGRDPFRRQFRDWDVENAADQRGKEQENRGVGTDAGIAHRSQDEHDDEKADQDREEAGRQWQVHMAHPYRRYSISLVPGYHRAKLNL